MTDDLTQRAEAEARELEKGCVHSDLQYYCEKCTVTTILRHLKDKAELGRLANNWQSLHDKGMRDFEALTKRVAELETGEQGYSAEEVKRMIKKATEGLDAELKEQCRLLGKSGTREAELQAKVEKAVDALATIRNATIIWPKDESVERLKHVHKVAKEALKDLEGKEGRDA